MTIVTEELDDSSYPQPNVDESATDLSVGTERAERMAYVLYPFAIAVAAFGTTLAFV